MTIEFLYTFAEYQEANRAHLTPRKASQRALVQLFLAASFLCLIDAAIGPVPKYSSSATTVPVRIGLGDFVGSLAPYCTLLFLLLILILLVRPKLSISQRRFDDLSSAGGRFAPMVLILLAISAAYLSVVLASIRQPTAGAVHTASGSDENWWIGLIPTVVVLVFIWFITLRRAFKARWKIQPALARHKTMEYSAETISVSDDLSASFHRWAAILRCVETANLFILYPSGMTFIPVPKRAFQSAAVDEFRDLIREWEDGRAVGFPVIHSVAALPVATGDLSEGV
jgi:uncharacterized membrane protein YhaH (DUF805 family)